MLKMNKKYAYERYCGYYPEMLRRKKKYKDEHHFEYYFKKRNYSQRIRIKQTMNRLSKLYFECGKELPF